jgi:hypothetical protein
LVTNPKCSIRFTIIILNVSKTNCFLQLLIPFVRFRTPISFPFIILKRTSEIDQKVPHDLFN